MHSAEKQSESWSVTRELEGRQSSRRVEKFSKSQQQSALQFLSCSCDFLRMLRCFCFPRREQTGCCHCALPIPGKVIVSSPHLYPSSSSGISCCPHGTMLCCKSRKPCGQVEDLALPLNFCCSPRFVCLHLA